MTGTSAMVVCGATCSACYRYQQPVYPNFTSGGKMNYEEHRAATRRGLDAVDITKSGSTHEARKAGAQHVLDMG